MTNNCINCISTCPSLPHTNPMESGSGNTFSAQNRKKTKRFMISDTKKGDHFFDPAPPPPQKMGFKWGSGQTKHSLGDGFLDKMIILQGVKPTIQRFGVGYANRPKKAQNGGLCGIFPCIRAYLALI